MTRTITIYFIAMSIIGLSIASMSSLVRAPLADRFDKNTLIRTYTWVAIASNVAPFFATYCSSHILLYLGWHYCFIFVALFVFALLIASILWYPETHANANKKINIKKIIKQIISVLKHKVFWQYGIIYSFVAGYMISYFASLPFWYIKQFHLPMKLLSLLTVPVIVAYILGGMCNNYLLRFVKAEKLLYSNLILLFIFALLFFIHALIFSGDYILLTIINLFFFFIAGFIIPLSNSLPYHKLREHSGVLPGLFSGCRCLTAGILLPICTSFHFHSFVPFAVFMLILSSAILFVYRRFGDYYKSSVFSEMSV